MSTTCLRKEMSCIPTHFYDPVCYVHRRRIRLLRFTNVVEHEGNGHILKHEKVSKQL